MKAGKLIEGFGFLLEVNCFFLAGVFLFINKLISIFLYSFGLALSVLVGKQIIKNKIKEGLLK